MKYIQSILLAVCALTASSCGNTGARTAVDSDNSATDHSASSPQSTFSCQINGKPVTGNGVDGLQLQNTAFLYHDKTIGDQLIFGLVSTKDGSDDKPDYALRIKCPAKVGTFNRKANDDFDAKTMPGFTLDFKTGDFSRYNVGGGTGNHDIATVTFTSIDSKRITGTFQTVLSLSGDTPRGTVKNMQVTNGKFDIPFSTGKLRPE